jgi:hypothetical protein
MCAPQRGAPFCCRVPRARSPLHLSSPSPHQASWCSSEPHPPSSPVRCGPQLLVVQLHGLHAATATPLCPGAFTVISNRHFLSYLLDVTTQSPVRRSYRRGIQPYSRASCRLEIPSECVPTRPSLRSLDPQFCHRWASARSLALALCPTPLPPVVALFIVSIT